MLIQGSSHGNPLFQFGNVKISGAGDQRTVTFDGGGKQKQNWFQDKWFSTIANQIDRAFGNAPGTYASAQKRIKDKMAQLQASVPKKEPLPTIELHGDVSSQSSSDVRMSSLRDAEPPTDMEMREIEDSLLNNPFGFKDYVERNWQRHTISNEPLGNVFEIMAERRSAYAESAPVSPNATKVGAAPATLPATQSTPAEAATSDFEKMHGLSEAEAFEYILNNGTIEKMLSQSHVSEGSMDIERTIESYAYHAAAYQSLQKELFADSDKADSVQAALDEAMSKGLDNVSSGLAKDLADYFAKGGIEVDADALAGAIKEIAAERVSAYQTLFDEGQISTDHTMESAQSAMYGEMSKGRFEAFEDIKVETQFGEISYDDLSGISDAIDEFEDALALKDYPLGNTAEELGIRLGMAKAQVGLMNDGSALYSAFMKAADARIVEEKQAAVEANRQARNGTNYAAEGYSYSSIDMSAVDRYIGMFANVNRDNMASAIQNIMDSIARDYISRPLNDASYNGSYAVGNGSLGRNMPDEYHQDRAKLALENRALHISTAENYAMASWNEWLGTTRNVQNPGRYMLSSEYNSVDYSV